MNKENIVIWGTGREGRAAQTFLKTRAPAAAITFIDEAQTGDPAILSTTADIEKALKDATMIVKSPGVSLYHPLLREYTGKVTSLLNLWMDHRPAGRLIAITGTKGKSTTASLLGHVMNALGHKTAVLGNIGVPVTQAPAGMEFLVLEMSSYQTADFKGAVEVAAVTSLYPEHLNWHGTLESYYRDKLNLLNRAKIKIVHPQVKSARADLPPECVTCEIPATVPNDYLNRAHNRDNAGVVLSVVKELGLDTHKALQAMHDFKGLPHRQYELGQNGGLTFIDDSISTTPQAAIAALEAYKGSPITLIAGGYDRGIDYAPLADYIAANAVGAVVTLGPSGARIQTALQERGYTNSQKADDIVQAVHIARKTTPPGGIVLLSPAAPSFGLFKDYVERGKAFAKAADIKE